MTQEILEDVKRILPFLTEEQTKDIAQRAAQKIIARGLGHRPSLYEENHAWFTASTIRDAAVEHFGGTPVLNAELETASGSRKVFFDLVAFQLNDGCSENCAGSGTSFPIAEASRLYMNANAKVRFGDAVVGLRELIETLTLRQNDVKALLDKLNVKQNLVVVKMAKRSQG